MAGADDRRKKQSVEDFLFARLSLDDDEPDDDEPGDALESPATPASPESPATPALPGPAPAPVASPDPSPADPLLTEDDTTHPEPDPPESALVGEITAPTPWIVEPETQPFPSDDDGWSTGLELVEEPAPPLPDPPPWERDTDPTPDEWELPAAAPEDSVVFAPDDRGAAEIDFGPSGTPVAPEAVTRQYRRDGDTAPLPETQTFPPPDFDDEPSEGPELSDPGPWALAETTQEPEIEDLEEPSLSRGPALGGGFDEVFPAWGLKVPDRALRPSDEETNALLQMTDGGMPTESRGPPRGTPGHRPRELEPVGADPNEPATQWHQQLPPARGRMAEEKTEIRGFQPYPLTPELDPDDAPTVIVAPPTAVRPGREPTPRPAPVTPARPTTPPPAEDPRTTAVIAWTASALGVLMFVAVLVAGTAVAWQYVGF